MLAILQILNKVLDIKLVQYALMTLVIILIFIVGVDWIRIKQRDYEIDDLRRVVAETSASLAIQNREIQKLGEVYKSQTEAYKASIDRATKAALDMKKKLEEIDGLRLEGSCEEKLNTTINYIKSKP